MAWRGTKAVTQKVADRDAKIKELQDANKKDRDALADFSNVNRQIQEAR